MSLVTLQILVLALYAMNAVLIIRYTANLAVAVWNLMRAWVGAYHPNGAGYMPSWWYSLDCLANTVIGGDPHETISARAGKARTAGRLWGCVLCRMLGWIVTKVVGQPTDYCADSMARDALTPHGE